MLLFSIIFQESLDFSNLISFSSPIKAIEIICSSGAVYKNDLIIFSDPWKSLLVFVSLKKNTANGIEIDIIIIRTRENLKFIIFFATKTIRQEI